MSDKDEDESVSEWRDMEAFPEGDSERPKITVDDDPPPDQTPHWSSSSGSDGGDGDKYINDIKGDKNKLRNLFLVIFLIGSYLILTTPLAKYTDSPNLQTYISIAIMFVYYFKGKKYARTHNAKTVFADSIYYLGFLYTFVALLGAMSHISVEDVKIMVIIGQMGPALATTVVGMLGRIYLTQFEAITEEPDTDILNTLSQLSTDFIVALGELEKYSKTSSKILTKSQEKTTKKLEEFIDRIEKVDLSGVSEQVANFKEVVDFAEVTLNIKQAAKKVEENSKDMAKFIEEASYAIDYFNKTMNTANQQLTKVQDFSENLETIKKTISDSNEQISNVVSHTKEEVISTARGLSSDFRETRGAAISLKKKIKDLLEDILDFLNKHK